MIQLASPSSWRWVLIAALAHAAVLPGFPAWGRGGAGGEDNGLVLAKDGVVAVPPTVRTNPVPGSSRVAIQPGSAAVPEGGEVRVPVLTSGFTNIQFIRFTLAWDPAVLQWRSTENWGLPGLGPAQFALSGEGRLTFWWLHPSQGAAALDTNTPAFVVRFRALGPVGVSTPVQVVSDPVPLEVAADPGQVLEAVAGEGLVQVVRGFQVSGALTYRDTPVAVTNFSWQLGAMDGGVIGAGAAESNRFGVAVPARGVFRLGLAKTNDSAVLRGVSSLDLVLIRRHVLGLASIASPLGRLAADADGAGSITTLDLALLRRWILGTASSVPAGAWRFVPSSHVFAAGSAPWNAPRERTFENLDGPRAGEDFLALKIGDVDGSWAAGAPAARENRLARGDGEQALLALTSVRAGVTGAVTVAMVVTNFTAVQALQFSLAWDPAKLTYNGWTAGALPGFGSGNVGGREAAAGRLAVSWDDMAGGEVTLPDGSVLLELHFTAGTAPGVSAVAFTDDPTPRELARGLAAEQLLTVDGRVEVVGQAGLALRLERSGPGGPVTLVFSPPPELVYEIQYSEDLLTWHTVRAPQVKVVGETAWWTDDGSQTPAPDMHRYYRITTDHSSP